MGKVEAHERQYHYTTDSGERIKVERTINYLDTLGIASGSQGKEEFRSKISNPSRAYRVSLSLAYHINSCLYHTLSGSHTSFGVYAFAGPNKVRCNFTDPFTLCAIGSRHDLEVLIIKDPTLLDATDVCGYSLLYIACRSGFYDVVKMLLKHGVDVNTQKGASTSGSTPLHVAGFYGHVPVVSLLLKCGADPTIRNNFGNTALEEATLLSWASMKCAIVDDLRVFLREAGSSPLVDFVQPIYEFNESPIVAFRVVRALSKYRKHQCADWIGVWHGTKFTNLKTILKHGLKKPGSVLPNGKRIEIPANHIPENATVCGVSNWGGALFVSPSIAYAAHIAYSERLTSNNNEWCCVVNLRVKPGSFDEFPSTLMEDHYPLDGEPSLPEYRVQSDRDDTIMRVYSEQSCVVTAITFVSEEFLEHTQLSFKEIQSLLNLQM